MSMGLYICSFTKEEVKKMKADHKLIDQYILKDESYFSKTEVDTAWEVLEDILYDVKPWSGGSNITKALYNGCTIISAFRVKQKVKKLSQWTDERVLKSLAAIPKRKDLYYLDFYQNSSDMLLNLFHNLVECYQEAAERDLDIVIYMI